MIRIAVAAGPLLLRHDPGESVRKAVLAVRFQVKSCGSSLLRVGILSIEDRGGLAICIFLPEAQEMLPCAFLLGLVLILKQREYQRCKIWHFNIFLRGIRG